jgi:hypothetical protein
LNISAIQHNQSNQIADQLGFVPNFQNSSDQLDQPHTYLEEKYVQEAEAEARARPKYMKKTVRGFADGKGPSSVHQPRFYQ